MTIKKTTLAIPFLAALLAAGLLTGCNKTIQRQDAAASTTAAYAPQEINYESYTTETEAAMAAEDYAEPEMGEVAYNDTMGTSSAQVVPSTRKLIRNVSLQIETTEFAIMLSDITNTVTASGGYLQSSEIYGNDNTGSYGQAYLTIRVPANQLDSFIFRMEEQGNVTYKSESVEDVTLQYSDIESRKKALAIEQERLWELLAEAESVDAIIALEARLSDIRYQLESFESQLRLYDNQVDYSTIVLTLTEVRILSPATPDSIGTRIQKGLSRNIYHLGNEIVDTFIWVISSIPVLLINLLILAIVILILRLIINRIRKRIHKKRLPKE